MRIAICEDAQAAMERLSDAVKDWAAARNISVDIMRYESAEAFVLAWPDITFDILFLDIQMKKMSGIELAEFIRKSDKNMLIVFVTSFEQYSLKGYDFNALHFLVKPLSPTKLIPILDKAYTVWRSREKDAFVIQDGNALIKLPFCDIIYISMFSHTAELITTDKTYKLRKTAAELEQMLPSHFVRCHRSYIINLLKTDRVYKDSVLLSNGARPPISRNNSKNINDAFVRLHTE